MIFFVIGEITGLLSLNGDPKLISFHDSAQKKRTAIIGSFAHRPGLSNLSMCGRITMANNQIRLVSIQLEQITESYLFYQFTKEWYANNFFR